MRFVVKPVDKAWRVYDTITGSYPYQRADLGKVKQDTSQSEAQAEADRLNGDGP